MVTRVEPEGKGRGPCSGAWECILHTKEWLAMQNDIVPNENASLSMYISIYIVYTQCLTIDKY